jgi:hypothetical protein
MQHRHTPQRSTAQRQRSIIQCREYRFAVKVSTCDNLPSIKYQRIYSLLLMHHILALNCPRPQPYDRSKPKKHVNYRGCPDCHSNIPMVQLKSLSMHTQGWNLQHDPAGLSRHRPDILSRCCQTQPSWVTTAPRAAKAPSALHRSHRAHLLRPISCKLDPTQKPYLFCRFCVCEECVHATV